MTKQSFLGLVILFVVLGVIFGGLALAASVTPATSTKGLHDPGGVLAFGIVLFAFFFLIWALGMSMRKRTMRNYSFEIGAEQITIRRGNYAKIETHIPYDKVQDVVVQQGIMMRRAGLYSLTIQTAAGPLLVPMGMYGARNSRAAIAGLGGAQIVGIRNGPQVAQYILAKARTQRAC